MQGICAIRKLFSGPVDVVRVLAAVDAAAVPDRVGGQIFGPGMVARGIEVDAVLRGVVVDLAAVGGHPDIKFFMYSIHVLFRM